MDDMERFVIDGNISRFVDKLRAETDPFRRQTLKSLLIAEENRFGMAEDRLQIVERHLTDGQALIPKQSRLVIETRNNGGDVGPAERLLRIFESIQDLLHSFHAVVHEETERRRP